MKDSWLLSVTCNGWMIYIYWIIVTLKSDGTPSFLWRLEHVLSCASAGETVQNADSQLETYSITGVVFDTDI